MLEVRNWHDLTCLAWLWLAFLSYSHLSFYNIVRFFFFLLWSLMSSGLSMLSLYEKVQLWFENNMRISKWWQFSFWVNWSCKFVYAPSSLCYLFPRHQEPINPRQFGYMRMPIAFKAMFTEKSSSPSNTIQCSTRQKSLNTYCVKMPASLVLTTLSNLIVPVFLEKL